AFPHVARSAHPRRPAGPLRRNRRAATGGARRAVKIYTKGGDAGQTSLFDGSRVGKNNARVAAYGDVDELNACIGVARAAAGDSRLQDLGEVLESIQADLFSLGALLADPRRDGGAAPAGRRAQAGFDEALASAL